MNEELISTPSNGSRLFGWVGPGGRWIRRPPAAMLRRRHHCRRGGRPSIMDETANAKAQCRQGFTTLQRSVDDAFQIVRRVLVSAATT